MKFSRSQVLPFLGSIVLTFFIAISYFNNQIFLDKILLCSVILGMIYFYKMRGESSNLNDDTVFCNDSVQNKDC